MRDVGEQPALLEVGGARLTKFMQKSFSSGPVSDAYRENYDRIFGKKPKLNDVDAAEFDVLQRIDDAHKVECGFPDIPAGLEEQILRFHKEADEKWERGLKADSSELHDHAYQLGVPYGLNPVRCGCGLYLRARDLRAHMLKDHK